MAERTSKVFLFVGNVVPDAAADKLKATGVSYRHKKLESGPANWEAISAILASRELAGVIVKLTGRDFMSICTKPFQAVAGTLFAALGKVPHVVFVHEGVLKGAGGHPAAADQETNADYDPDKDTYHNFLVQTHFITPPLEVRDRVLAILEECCVDVLPYRTNAELSVMAAAFVERVDNNLLFRVYVPAGRLYAAEADRLLSLFRDWLTQVRGKRVRQDGYQTANGRVYELFGDEDGPGDLSVEFSDFSRFLELCVDDPREASRQLRHLGLQGSRAEEIVGRCGRETRRLQLDARHAREAAMLSIRHRLESELSDELDIFGGDTADVGKLVEEFVPRATDLGTTLAPSVSGAAPIHVTVNQQIVQSVEGIVMQGVQGTAGLTVEAQQLMELVQEFGGEQASGLQGAVHELEDEDARQEDRLVARQRLKGFLLKVSGKVGEAGLGVLQRYVETRLGL